MMAGVIVAAFTSSFAIASTTKIAAACEQHLSAASSAQAVPLGLLYAVALTETGSGGELNPYALNIEGKSFLARNKLEALAAFENARGDNKSLIDLGCMQVNYYYHQQGFSKVEDMLDPRLNVNYAAKLLRTLKQKHGSWTEAVARYHASPKNKIAQHRYVCKVLTNLVTTGFGSWTPESRLYCSGNAR